MSQKGYLSIMLILLLLLVLAGCFYYFKSYWPNQNIPEFSANQNLQTEIKPSQTSKMIYSQDKQYQLLLNYEVDNQGKISCTKTIYNSLGFEISPGLTSTVLNDLTCIQGMELYLDGFKNFSGHHIVFNAQGTEIKILNLSSGEVESINYALNHESQDYGFMGADAQLKYLLFSKDGHPFIDQVKDYQGNEIFNIQPLLILDQENNPRIQSYYDSVNHGILYLSTFDNRFQFDYFDLQTNKMRRLKTISKNPASVGRGCIGNFLYPEENKLKFLGGCIDVLPKERNEKGEIVFNI